MYTLNCRGKLVVIDQPMVMGIINTTPDSFFANSRKTQVEEAVATAMQMQKAGAAMVDIGGQSTRPGADWVGAAEETDRVVPVIAAIAAAKPKEKVKDATPEEKRAAAEALGEWLPQVVEVDMKDERKKLKLAVLRGEA